MNLRRFAGVCTLLLLTTVGCCHTQCVSSDPCNSCGCGTGGGCCLTDWCHRQFLSWRMRHNCHNYNWGCECSGPCPVCGGSSCGMGCGGACGSPSGCGGGAAGCGCGQSGSTQGWSGAAPTPTYSPGAAPTPPAPAPLTVPQSDPPPVPASTDPATTFQSPGSGQMQQVSYEEFQRLPGVVVSGSGAPSSVPSMGQPSLPPPPLSTVSTPPRAGTGVQQAQWVPAR